MSMICGLCGSFSELPVLSPVSGTIFCKGCITRHIGKHGTDPVSVQYAANGSRQQHLSGCGPDAWRLSTDMLIDIRIPTILPPQVSRHETPPRSADNGQSGSQDQVEELAPCRPEVVEALKSKGKLVRRVLRRRVIKRSIIVNGQEIPLPLDPVPHRPQPTNLMVPGQGAGQQARPGRGTGSSPRLAPRRDNSPSRPSHGILSRSPIASNRRTQVLDVDPNDEDDGLAARPPPGVRSVHFLDVPPHVFGGDQNTEDTESDSGYLDQTLPGGSSPMGGPQDPLGFGLGDNGALDLDNFSWGAARWAGMIPHGEDDYSSDSTPPDSPTRARHHLHHAY